jgi:hypothetical protein
MENILPTPRASTCKALQTAGEWQVLAFLV